MLVFTITAAVMTLAALAFVAMPFWRKPPARLATADSNIAILKAQREEVLREFSTGAISEAERDQALDELVRRLSDDLQGEPDATAPAAGGRHWPVLIASSVFVTLLAAGMYWKLGTPDALNLVAAAAPESTHAQDQQILAMVDALAAKLREQPGDAKGWALLGRSQSALGRFGPAVEAFERAYALEPGNAQLLADYADAFAMTQQGSLEGKAWELVLLALKADPDNRKALAIAGTGELNRRNFPAAIAHWERLKALLPPGSDDEKQVAGAIMEVKLAMGSAPAAQKPASTTASATPAAPAAAGGAGVVSGTVNISPAMAKQVALTDTLFIFARAATQGGPRMPLAVLRAQARELPRQFELTDAMAMAPTFKLSDFPEVVIEARISKSGNAQSQPGDLVGISKPVRPGARNVVVNIERAVP